jgi:hypothetical protein
MVKERRLTSLQEVNQVVIQERRVRPSHRTLGKKKVGGTSAMARSAEPKARPGEKEVAC